MIRFIRPNGEIESIYYRDIFRAAPHNYMLFAPDTPRFTILDGTDCFLKSLGMKREQVIGCGLFDRFPDNPKTTANNTRELMNSLMRVMETKKSDSMKIVRYDIPVVGTDKFEERYWAPENDPLLDHEGNIVLIIHTAIDISSIRKTLGF